MEPKLPVPNPSQEMGTYNPQVLPPRPIETASPTRVEATPERSAPQEVQPAGPVQGAPVLPPPAPLASPSTVPVVPVLQPLATTDHNPAIAADEEVIEKEWVDKAKKIVAQTKDDPYKQEKEVSKLQADYLKKRYGKEVKLTND
jgi:hypothetical protein